MRSMIHRLACDYGMLAVLGLLGIVFSVLTLEEQSATDAGAAKRLVAASGPSACRTPSFSCCCSMPPRTCS